MRSLLLFCCVLSFAALHAGDRPRFRTDADGPVQANETRVTPKDRNPDGKPDWYPLVDGESPPESSAHAVPGELIQVDHPERRFRFEWIAATARIVA